MQQILQARGLRKSYGGVAAVDGVDFSVAAGEIVGLIGPNGAGKSTCFNLLTGQLAPDQGSVRLFDTDVTGWPPRRIWRLGVGRTFQVAAVFASMTVCENVQMGLISHHRRWRSWWPPVGRLYRSQALELLEVVGLADRAQLSCSALAYGDIKRLELAMALTNQPRLLLMDEPTAGMASEERMDVMAVTAQIARTQGVAVLFTEHDMDVVFTHADRLIVLARGQILAAGDPTTVAALETVQQAYLGAGTLFTTAGP